MTLVYSETFDSGTGGFFGSLATLSNTGGHIRVTNTHNNFGAAKRSIGGLLAGEVYRVTWEATQGSSIGVPTIHLGIPTNWNEYGQNLTANQVDFAATEAILDIYLNTNSAMVGQHNSFDILKVELLQDASSPFELTYHEDFSNFDLARIITDGSSPAPGAGATGPHFYSDQLRWGPDQPVNGGRGLFAKREGYSGLNIYSDPSSPSFDPQPAFSFEPFSLLTGAKNGLVFNSRRAEESEVGRMNQPDVVSIVDGSTTNSFKIENVARLEHVRVLVDGVERTQNNDWTNQHPLNEFGAPKNGKVIVAFNSMPPPNAEIRFQNRPHIWLSSALTTKGFFEQKYGRFSFKGKLPDVPADGIWLGVWLLSKYEVEPPEFDIVELSGSAAKIGSVHCAIHKASSKKNEYSDPSPENRSGWLNLPDGFSIQDEFEVTLDWDYETVTWFVNGTQVFARPNPFFEEMYLVFTIEISPGQGPNPPDFNQATSWWMEPITGTTQSPNRFELYEIRVEQRPEQRDYGPKIVNRPSIRNNTKSRTIGSDDLSRYDNHVGNVFAVQSGEYLEADGTTPVPSNRISGWWESKAWKILGTDNQASYTAESAVKNRALSYVEEAVDLNGRKTRCRSFFAYIQKKNVAQPLASSSLRTVLPRRVERTNDEVLGIRRMRPR